MDEQSLAHKIVAYYVNPIMFLVGFFGNGLSILVFKKKIFHTSTTVYLLMLAVISFAFIIVYIPFIVKEFVMDGSNTYKWIMISYQCYIGSYLMEIFALSGSWMVMAVAVERCIVVGLPFKSRLICRRKTAWFVCFGILVIAALLSIPNFLQCGPRRITNASSNGDDEVIMDVYDLPGYNIRYAVAGSILISSIIPFSIVLVSDIILVVLMIKRWVNTSKLTADGNVDASRTSANVTEKRAITILVIANVSLYLVSHSMTAVIHFKIAVKGMEYYYKVMDESIGFFSNTLVISFFCFSSIVYLIISRLFRKKAKKLFCSVIQRSQVFSSSIMSSIRSRTRTSQFWSPEESTNVNSRSREEATSKV